jgi:hypothetical protein
MHCYGVLEAHKFQGYTGRLSHGTLGPTDFSSKETLMHALVRSAFVKTVLPVLLTIGTMAAADFTGTWKFNPAKSQYRRDLSEEMLTIKQTGPDSYTSIVDFVTKSGEKRHQEIVRICDGKEHPSPRSGAAKGAVLICQLGPGATRKFVESDNGKVVYEVTSTLSDDGKVMTTVWKDSNGEDVLVFDRQ